MAPGAGASSGARPAAGAEGGAGTGRFLRDAVGRPGVGGASRPRGDGGLRERPWDAARGAGSRGSGASAPRAYFRPSSSHAALNFGVQISWTV
ncbi:hypothetical protein GCM10023329_08110 [Streptomyces sanyensis]|uniref:Uncharacterized protein n=1 Tax=Streptomyces sanyensis TaxID=568869 RepID=A0ABP8ZS44_9ACTN